MPKVAGKKAALLAMSVLAVNVGAAAGQTARSTASLATSTTPTPAPTAASEDTASPNEPISKPDCDAAQTVSIRYSSSSARAYLESGDGTTRGGCVTLEQIWEARKGKAPLYAVDPNSGEISKTATGTWLLTESLYVEDGITLKVCGWAKNVCEVGTYVRQPLHYLPGILL